MRIGLYPGTFDPITNGHLDIIGRAVKLFDKLIIGIAINRDKGPLFSLDERVEMVMSETAKFKAEGSAEIVALPYENLLMHFAESVNASVIVRGLRAVADFEYEFQMTAMNQQLNRDIQTVFLVKEISRLGGDINAFVSPNVAERLSTKYGVVASPTRKS